MQRRVFLALSLGEGQGVGLLRSTNKSVMRIMQTLKNKDKSLAIKTRLFFLPQPLTKRAVRLPS